jgi:hypothetical protein
MASVMNEEHLEAGVIGQQAQASVEVVVTLVPSEVIKELMQANEDIGETFATNANRIYIHLEKIVLMIKEQKNVVFILVPKQDTANEDVEPHAHIDGSDKLNFTYYNLLSRPFFKWKRWVGFFWVKFVIIIPSLIVVFKPLPHLLSHMEKVGGAFFCSKFLSNTSRFYKSYCFF